MATIAEFCASEGNAPGLKRKLYITCDGEVATIPAPAADTHKITGNVTMETATPANVFLEWHFGKEDQEFKSVEGENGEWATTFKIFVPKLKDTTSYTLNNHGGDNNIVIVEDMNGKRRLIGEKLNGCTLKVTEQTNPRNGYIVEGSWTSGYSPYFYEGTIPV